MTNVFKILQNLFDMLKTAFDFAIGIIEDIVYISTLLPKLVANMISTITIFIPAPALVFITSLITLTVIYRVLGRD